MEIYHNFAPNDGTKDIQLVGEHRLYKEIYRGCFNIKNSLYTAMEAMDRLLVAEPQWAADTEEMLSLLENVNNNLNRLTDTALECIRRLRYLEEHGVEIVVEKGKPLEIPTGNLKR